MVSASAVDRDWAIAIRACDNECAARHRAAFAVRVEALRPIVSQLRPISRVTVIAPWPGGYRVDSVVVEDSAARTLEASREWGFRPSSTATLADGGDAVFRNLGVARSALVALVAALRAEKLAAVVREPSGAVRLVDDRSVGNREWGLLFTEPREAVPTPGTVFADGRRLVAIDAIASGVHFYLTR
jgi:hypothetical protein